MADFFLPGDFLRNTRGILLSDAGGLTWSWDPATNTLTASAVAATDAETLDGIDSTGFALVDLSNVNPADTLDSFEAAVGDAGADAILGWDDSESAIEYLTAAEAANIVNSQLDHGLLQGLSDDDHPQYPRQADAEAIAGQWTFSAGLIAGAPIRLPGYTVATLPGSPTQGDTAFVTDALAPAFLTTVVGGGAIVTPVFYDGTNWVSY